MAKTFTETLRQNTAPVSVQSAGKLPKKKPKIVTVETAGKHITHNDIAYAKF